MIWSNFLPRRFAPKGQTSNPEPEIHQGTGMAAEASTKNIASQTSAMGALMGLIAAQGGGCQLSMVAPQPKTSDDVFGSIEANTTEKRWMAWVASPYMPSVAALAAMGIDPSRLLFIHARDEAHAVGVVEQALRSGTCGAVFAWLSGVSPEVQARLQQAAQAGGAWGTVFHDAKGFGQGDAKHTVMSPVIRPMQDRLAQKVVDTTTKAAARVRHSIPSENYNLQLDF
jgi:hypothetical protein